MNVKKRFIAGAICPQCGAMDSIRVYRLDNSETQECIHCDYQQQQQLNAVKKNTGAAKPRSTHSASQDKDAISIKFIEP